MLVVYIATGLFFMLLPGTLVGVANLLTISASHTPRAADAGWVQAHGHAQIFGWLGTFILGIGYFAIPRLRLAAWSPVAAWTTYALWTTGVAMRWAVGTWPWQWRVLFPLAGLLELAAVLVFCVSVFFARPRMRDDKWRTSIVMITAGGWGMFAAVAIGAWMSFRIDAPMFPFDFNQRYLALITWGFVVPFVWGFSTRWLPPLLGLRPTRKAWLKPALALLAGAVVIAMTGALLLSAIVALAASLVFVLALRMWEPSAKEPKLRGVHHWTPAFLRIAYAWLAIAAILSIVSAALPLPNGWAGASRHALTVGFFAVAVFAIGPRVLPAFFGVQRLWSTRLMAAVLVLVNAGCTLRVTSQILAYEGISAMAWKVLPASAVIEMAAVILFAVNMMMTLTTGSPLETFLEAQRERELAAQG
jgi:uncharacterized protein involved in response to NO